MNKGDLVKWVTGNDTVTFAHFGRVTEIFNDEVTVEYGSGNKSMRRRFDADQLEVTEQRQGYIRDDFPPVKRRSRTPKPDAAPAPASDGVETSSSTPPKISTPRPPKVIVSNVEAEEAVRLYVENNAPAARADIIEACGLDLPTYTQTIANLLAAGKIVKTGAKRGTRYHPAITEA